MNEIEALIIPDSGQSFKGDDFRKLCLPCVYMFMENGLPIYIGMSSSGISRPSQSAHRQWCLARKECDEVRIYPCKSVDAAVKLERILLCRTQPKHNRNGLQHYVKQRLGNSLHGSNIA